MHTSLGHMRLVVPLLLVASGLLGSFGHGIAQAASFDCTAGNVACLIAAIEQANANGEPNTLTLEAGTYVLTAFVDRSEGLPVVTGTLDIIGAGAGLTVIESAGGPRIFNIATTGTLSLQGLTLQGMSNLTVLGGAIFNAGTLVVTQTTIANNSAAGVGGILNEGTLVLSHSLLDGNAARFGGAGAVVNEPNAVAIITSSTFKNNGADSTGGLSNAGTATILDSSFIGNGSRFSGAGAINNDGTLHLTNTTIAQNSGSQGSAGGITNAGTLVLRNCTVTENTSTGGATGGLSAGATTTLVNTIVALNTQGDMGPPRGGPDCSGLITSQGSNLFGDLTRCTVALTPTDRVGDPGLGEFTDDGMPGHGHVPLLPGSPAIDAGNDAFCPPTDQLGERRVGPCDIGAIEFRPLAVDSVAIRLALFVNRLASLVIVATSSAAPDAELFVTVPACLLQAPMARVQDRYILLRTVPECEDLDGQMATVTSSRGGSASTPVR